MLRPARGTPHDQYIVLTDISTVIEFLSSLRRGQFQSHVALLPDGRVAIRANARIREKLESVAAPAHWNVEFRSLEECRTLEHRPLCEEFVKKCYSPKLDERWARTGPHTRFLLRAETAGKAQQVKDLLLAARSEQIELRFVAFGAIRETDSHETENGHARKEAYYWSVLGAPPGAVIEAADGVWYEATTCSLNNQVFLPVRYSANVADSVLERMNWRQENGLVLLPAPIRPGLPRKPLTCVRIGSDHARFEPLIHVAAVETNRQPIEVADAAVAPTTFPVKVQLVKSSARRALAERVLQLDREIEARQEMQRKLSARLEQAAPERGGWEPLFLYGAPDGRIPDLLQKLLHQWCDQTELQWLCYARIRVASWGRPGQDGESEWLHALTTASALGRPSELGQTAWLAEYAPEAARRFRAAPGWSEHGLHLFEPDDAATRESGGLSLYPDIPPGPIAANNLGRGMVDDEEADAGDYLILLRPGRSASDPLEACRVLRAAFRPLVTMIPWKCSVSVRRIAVDADPAESAPLPGSEARFARSVEQAFEQSAKRTEADIQTQLTKSWEAHLTTIEQRQARLHATLAGHEAEAERLERALGSAQANLSSLADRQARLRRLAGRAETDWTTIAAAADEGLAVARRIRNDLSDSPPQSE